MEAIISSLRSSAIAPPEIVVRMGIGPHAPVTRYLAWVPRTLNHWLHLAGRCRALITIVSPSLFPFPNVRRFAAIKETIEAENIPQLMPLPAHDPQQMTFNFVNGAQVKLLLE